jgi:hypothetical protein
MAGFASWGHSLYTPLQLALRFSYLYFSRTLVVDRQLSRKGEERWSVYQ